MNHNNGSTNIIDIGKRLYLDIGLRSNLGHHMTRKFPYGIALKCTNRDVWKSVKFFSMGKQMNKP